MSRDPAATIDPPALAERAFTDADLYFETCAPAGTSDLKAAYRYSRIAGSHCARRNWEREQQKGARDYLSFFLVLDESHLQPIEFWADDCKRLQEALRSSCKQSLPSNREAVTHRRFGQVDPKAGQVKLIAEAEVEPVAPEDLTTFIKHLFAFIEENRDSADQELLIAVGSAIRKLIAILPPKELPSVAGLLESGHRASVPLEVELEVAKSVVRRLSIQSISVGEEWNKLADRLQEIAVTYLNDRMLPREYYAATAINAVLALALIDSKHLTLVVERLNALKLNWFRSLLSRRAARLDGQLSKTLPSSSPVRNALCEITATAIT